MSIGIDFFHKFANVAVKTTSIYEVLPILMLMHYNIFLYMLLFKQ